MTDTTREIDAPYREERRRTAIIAEPAASGVSWAAVIGGAFAAAAAGMILLALGSGFGLLSLSAWSGVGASLTTFTVASAIWLVVVQWLSAGLGGYLTGRLRTRWRGVHTHEAFFRDTANGFLAWAVGTVLATVVLGGAAAAIAGAGVHAGATVASGAVQGMTSSAPSLWAYGVDSLFRSENPRANVTDEDIHREAARILANGLASGEIPADDRAYLARLVAATTGISQEDAEGRVDRVITMAKATEMKAREAAEAARKASAYLSFFTAFSLLIGAFIASAAGALGGQHRDELDSLPTDAALAGPGRGR